jgi:hypothetical protein
LEDMESLYERLCAMNEGTMSDREFTIAIFNNAPTTESWRVAIAGLRTKFQQYESQGTPIKSSEFIANVRDENWYYNKHNPQSSAYVFAACAGGAKKGVKRTSTSDTASATKRPRPSNAPAKTCTNPNCTRKGHTLSECVTFGGGNLGNYPEWWKGPWNLHLPSDKRSLDNNIPPANHPAFKRLTAAAKAAVCFYDPSSQNTLPNDDPCDEDESGADESSILGEEPSTSFAWNTFLDDTIPSDPAVAQLSVLSVQLPRTDLCHYDSGANRHVFHDRTAFDTYETITPTPVKGFGHKLSAMAIGRGTVRVEARCGTRKSIVTLRHVLHIPATRSNLISGTILAKAGVTATLADPSAVLALNGTPIISGEMQNDMFRLDMTIIRPTAKPTLLSRLGLVEAHAFMANADQRGFPIA